MFRTIDEASTAVPVPDLATLMLHPAGSINRQPLQTKTKSTARPVTDDCPLPLTPFQMFRPNTEPSTALFGPIGAI